MVMCMCGVVHDAPNSPTAAMRQWRRRSADVGGLHLAAMGSGQGQGWMDNEGEVQTRFAELLSDMYNQTSNAVNEHCEEFTPPPISRSTRTRLIRALDSWHFEPHKLCPDEILACTLLLFEALYRIEGLQETVGIQMHQIRSVILHLRQIYRLENSYHNFEHALDVLQATQCYLRSAGLVPPLSILLEEGDELHAASEEEDVFGAGRGNGEEKWDEWDEQNRNDNGIKKEKKMWKWGNEGSKGAVERKAREAAAAAAATAAASKPSSKPPNHSSKSKSNWNWNRKTTSKSLKTSPSLPNFSTALKRTSKPSSKPTSPSHPSNSSSPSSKDESSDPNYLLSGKPRLFDTPGDLMSTLELQDVFVLYIAAIGHDVGHPGFTNTFMKNAHAPLSQIFNNQSALEQMHCQLLMRVLRQHGFERLLDDYRFRRLLWCTVMATDMGVHQEFMRGFGRVIPGVTGSKEEEEMEANPVCIRQMMICQAVIKCADISNPSRPFSVSEYWATALGQEWTAQASLENSLALAQTVPTSAGPLAEAKGQEFFIGGFVEPLLGVMRRGVPELDTYYQQCTSNLVDWKARVQELSAATTSPPPPTPLRHPEDSPVDVTPGEPGYRSQLEGYTGAFPLTLPVCLGGLSGVGCRLEAEEGEEEEKYVLGTGVGMGRKPSNVRLNGNPRSSSNLNGSYSNSNHTCPQTNSNPMYTHVHTNSTHSTASSSDSPPTSPSESIVSVNSLFSPASESSASTSNRAVSESGSSSGRRSGSGEREVNGGGLGEGRNGINVNGSGSGSSSGSAGYMSTSTNGYSSSGTYETGYASGHSNGHANGNGHSQTNGHKHTNGHHHHSEHPPAPLDPHAAIRAAGKLGTRNAKKNINRNSWCASSNLGLGAGYEIGSGKATSMAKSPLSNGVSMNTTTTVNVNRDANGEVNGKKDQHHLPPPPVSAPASSFPGSAHSLPPTMVNGNGLAPTQVSITSKHTNTAVTTASSLPGIPTSNVSFVPKLTSTTIASIASIASTPTYTTTPSSIHLSSSLAHISSSPAPVPSPTTVTNPSPRLSIPSPRKAPMPVRPSVRVPTVRRSVAS